MISLIIVSVAPSLLMGNSKFWPELYFHQKIAVGGGSPALQRFFGAALVLLLLPNCVARVFDRLWGSLGQGCVPFPFGLLVVRFAKKT